MNPTQKTNMRFFPCTSAEKLKVIEARMLVLVPFQKQERVSF